MDEEKVEIKADKVVKKGHRILYYSGGILIAIGILVGGYFLLRKCGEKAADAVSASNGF